MTTPDSDDVQPAFILTSDVDWASEYCIDHFLNFCGEYGARPTMFVTHESARLRQAFENGEAEPGIHPNFCENSSHGNSIQDVISTVLGMTPSARLSRSHRFRSGSDIETALVDVGIQGDSNEVQYLAPDLAARGLWTGLVRFPIFFEDDVHWLKGGGWDFAEYEKLFFGPGLKVLNFHPFNLALNLSSEDGYLGHHQHIKTLSGAEARTMANTGAGAASFLRQIFEAVKNRNAEFTTLGTALDRYLASEK